MQRDHRAAVKGGSWRRARQGLLVWVGLASCAYAAALAIPGCGKLAGLDDYSVGDSPRCGALDLTGECAACMEQSCCAEAAACTESDDCALFARCTAKCDYEDGACRFGCFEQFPKTARSAVYFGCLVKSCATACAQCGGFGAPFGRDCDQCYAAKACKEATECANDAECAGFFGCVTEKSKSWVTDPGARAECDAQLAEYPVARELFGAILVKGSACTTECGWGRHWDCVGKFTWPQATIGSTTHLSIHVFDPLGGSVAGTLVAPCGLSGCDAPKLVEADGSVEFELNSGFGTYVEAIGPGVVSTRTYWEHPLYGDRTSRSIFVLTATEFDSMYGQIFQTAPPLGVGTVFVNMGDCVGTIDFRNQATLDVSFELEPAATNPIYADGAGSPNEQLPSAQRAWFFNVPPGLVTVTGFAPGQKVTPRPVKVDAGWMTVVWLNMPFAAQ